MKKNNKIVIVVILLLTTSVSIAINSYTSHNAKSTTEAPHAKNNISVYTPQSSINIKQTDTQLPTEPVFTGETVAIQDLFTVLEDYAVTTLEPSETIEAEFDKLVKTHNVTDNKQNYKDYVRIRLAFEATRDGGLWGVRWAITNKEPTSKNIWHQWQNIQQLNQDTASATAECDELSALFAVVARGLGVKDVGLFWPTWNHTVAVWTVDTKSNKRIVLPTSQIFLSKKASLGTKEFNPYKQKTIYNYEAKDIRLQDTLPASVANMMMSQVQQYAHLPQTELQKRRNTVSGILGGS